jgi:hypothetical protein
MNTASFRVSMFFLLGALSIAFLATANAQPKEEYVTGGEKGGGWEIYKNPDGSLTAKARGKGSAIKSPFGASAYDRATLKANGQMFDAMEAADQWAANNGYKISWGTAKYDTVDGTIGVTRWVRVSGAVMPAPKPVPKPGAQVNAFTADEATPTPALSGPEQIAMLGLSNDGESGGDDLGAGGGEGDTDEVEEIEGVNFVIGLFEGGSGAVVASGMGVGHVGMDEQASAVLAAAMNNAPAEAQALGYRITWGALTELRTTDDGGYTEVLVVREGALAQ